MTLHAVFQPQSYTTGYQATSPQHQPQHTLQQQPQQLHQQLHAQQQLHNVQQQRRWKLVIEELLVISQLFHLNKFTDAPTY